MMFADVPPAPQPQPQVIIVTGAALPDPAAERAYDVVTITRDQLEEAPAQNLDQILKGVPGLQLFRRSDSTSGHPTSQGVTLRALGGNASSRALLTLDGVPQSDPFGGWISWPAYDAASLDEIRVVRGGGSVRDGPGALAGVIQLKSLSDTGNRASLEFGSRESIAAQGYFASRLRAGSLTVTARGARSDGFIPLTNETRGPVDRPAPYRQGTIRARWLTPLASDIEMQTSALAFVDDRERGLPFTGNRTAGLDASIRLVGSGRWQWSSTLYGQRRNFRSSFASVNDDRTEAGRVALQDSVPALGGGARVEVRPPLPKSIDLRIGADAQINNGESRELYAFVGDDPARRRIAGGTSSTEGIFAEATATTGALTLSGGARIDHWGISDGELVERLLATGVATRDDHYPDRKGWRPTARMGVVADLGAGWSLRSAAYTGWRMPTLNELFRPFRVGSDATAANALLAPEKLAGIEAGVHYGGDGFSFSLAGFANRLSDAIANVTLGQGPGTFPGVGFVAGSFRQRLNIDELHVSGVEASGEVRRGQWSFSAGASYTRARIRAEGLASALDGLRPAQTPKISLTAEAGWHSGSRAASLELRHVGNQFEDDLNLRRMDAATTVDMFLAWPLARRARIVARAENLLNATVIAGIGDDQSVERATPRTLWLGIRLN